MSTAFVAAFAAALARGARQSDAMTMALAGHVLFERDPAAALIVGMLAKRAASPSAAAIVEPTPAKPADPPAEPPAGIPPAEPAEPACDESAQALASPATAQIDRAEAAASLEQGPAPAIAMEPSASSPPSRRVDDVEPAQTARTDVSAKGGPKSRRPEKD